MVLNSNVWAPIPETLSFTLFWNVFRGLKIPKMPIFTKKTYFDAYILIALLNFSKIKGKCVVICTQYKLNIFDLAKLLL